VIASGTCLGFRDVEATLSESPPPTTTPGRSCWLQYRAGTRFAADADDGRSRSAIKLNPLARWSSAQVLNIAHDVTRVTRRFVSIGCEPCTRAVLPNQHERAGRLVVEEATQKECGSTSRTKAGA